VLSLSRGPADAGFNGMVLHQTFMCWSWPILCFSFSVCNHSPLPQRTARPRLHTDQRWRQLAQASSDLQREARVQVLIHRVVAQSQRRFGRSAATDRRLWPSAGGGRIVEMRREAWECSRSGGSRISVSAAQIDIQRRSTTPLVLRLDLSSQMSPDSQTWGAEPLSNPQWSVVFMG
jgi:hypothetical protein